MDLKDKIKNITRYEYMNFMRYPNVVGVGRGNKYINDMDTGKLCIGVFVKEKYKKRCNREGCVPEYYFGIPTDVIETGEFTVRNGFRDKIRPAKMGYGISPLPRLNEIGTLGGIVKRNNPSGNLDFFILSCNHVMAGLNTLPIGTEIVQPGGSGSSTDVIAKLLQFEEINFATSESKPINYIDAAIAKITDINIVRPQIAFMRTPRDVEPIVF